MDYYELFGIKATPLADKIVVKKKYLELSRQHHPDFADNSDSQSAETALDFSANINKAYKILINPSLSIQYFLQYHQVIVEDEKYPLPNDFLMDMMDINELLEEAKSANDQQTVQEVKGKIEATEAELYNEVKDIVESNEAANMDANSMEKLKAYYYKKKYIHRILDGIS